LVALTACCNGIGTFSGLELTFSSGRTEPSSGCSHTPFPPQDVGSPGPARFTVDVPRGAWFGAARASAGAALGSISFGFVSLTTPPPPPSPPLPPPSPKPPRPRTPRYFPPPPPGLDLPPPPSPPPPPTPPPPLPPIPPSPRPPPIPSRPPSPPPP
ncbi:hypothetical protein VaNZ11_010733, partial [Volvox africanus]